MSTPVPNPGPSGCYRTGGRAWLAIGVGLMALASAPVAAAGTLHLRWMQPAGSAPVTGFRVYEGPAVGDGEVVFDGLPAAEGGAYTAEVALPDAPPGATTYVWVTAVGPGGESGPSRALAVGPPGELGAPGVPRFDLE